MNARQWFAIKVVEKMNKKLCPECGDPMDVNDHCYNGMCNIITELRTTLINTERERNKTLIENNKLRKIMREARNKLIGDKDTQYNAVKMEVIDDLDNKLREYRERKKRVEMENKNEHP